jgi:hypothetical protein
MKKKNIFLYKDNIILSDGSFIKLKSIKYFKNNQINYNFFFKKKKAKNTKKLSFIKKISI